MDDVITYLGDPTSGDGWAFLSYASIRLPAPIDDFKQILQTEVSAVGAGHELALVMPTVEAGWAR